MILPASLVAAAISMQPAADWRPLTDNEQVRMTWNAASPTRRGDTIVVSVKLEPRPLRTGENAYAIANVELHCARNEARIALTENFSSDGTAGTRDDSDLPYSAIPAQSFLENLRNLVCRPT